MRLTATHKMGIAALIMAGSVFLSRLMGLVRDKVVSWQFGAGAESDVYFAAFVVPDFLNYLLAGGYISITLIPLLSKRFEEDEADGWRFFSAVFWWAALGIAALTAVAWIFAPELARIVGPGFSPENRPGWPISCASSCPHRSSSCPARACPPCSISASNSWPPRSHRSSTTAASSRAASS